MTDLRGAIKERVGEAMTDIVVEQIQLFMSICIKFGVPKQTMDRAVSEYQMKTMINGIKMPKASKVAQILTDIVQPTAMIRHNDDITSSLPFYNNSARVDTWRINGNDVPVFSSLQLTDGYYPAVGDPEGAIDVATFAVVKNGDKYMYRHLTDEDKTLMDDMGIKHN